MKSPVVSDSSTGSIGNSFVWHTLHSRRKQFNLIELLFAFLSLPFCCCRLNRFIDFRVVNETQIVCCEWKRFSHNETVVGEDDEFIWKPKPINRLVSLRSRYLSWKVSGNKKEICIKSSFHLPSNYRRWWIIGRFGCLTASKVFCDLRLCFNIKS